MLLDLRSKLKTDNKTDEWKLAQILLAKSRTFNDFNGSDLGTRNIYCVHIHFMLLHLKFNDFPEQEF